MKKYSPIFVIIFVFFLATTVFAGQAIDRIFKNGELVVGTSGDYPPFTAKDKNGKAMGLDVDLGTAIASAMGVRAKVVHITFSDLLAALQSGKVDVVISAMTITPQRNLKVAFIGPYFISGQSIITTKETAFVVNGLQDINRPDFSMAVPAGTTSEIVAKNNISKAKLTVTKNMDEALKLLLDNEVKAVMTDSATASVAVFRNSAKGIMATTPLTFEPIGVAIPGDDPLFMNWLENFLTLLKGSGELDRMVDQWFKDPSWLKDMQ